MMESTANSKSYQNLCTQYYDLDKPSAPQDALAYYLGRAKGIKGAILEPMCGTGHFLIPLAEAKLDVTGFDSSLHMLNICRARFQDKNLRYQLFEASFENFKPETKYQLVFIPRSSFCLLTDPREASNALSLIYEWLEIDGKFIFEIETLNAVGVLPRIWKSNWMKKPDESLIVFNHTRQFDQKSSIETILCRYEHWENNIISQTEVEEFCLKLYSTAEIEKLLDCHGFEIEKRLQPYSCDAIQDDAQVILYECVKVNR